MYWQTASASLTAVFPSCGKYGTAGGFTAAIAHTTNVHVRLNVVLNLHTLE